MAILLSRSVHTYTALLGIGKAGATFVPIDPGAPADRVAYIVEDADVEVLVTSSEFDDLLKGLRPSIVRTDTDAPAISRAPATRPDPIDAAADPVAYVIYTSGSSGRPKGVLISQSSICNFLDVAPEVYGVRGDDRVYQGMTISFDFSIEEIWLTWARGATIVAGPTDSRRLGGELADFLDSARVTVLYCVPTLLATIPRELPGIRSILVGGEACPAHLVDRWARPGRRMLNTYGPTEATVTATVGELLPGRPVTIGRALPTYSIVLLDDDRAEVPQGEIGEICIGRPGVA
ncbi:AMP-binding protein, partial [Nocardia gipuzkoensis]